MPSRLRPLLSLAAAGLVLSVSGCLLFGEDPGFQSLAGNRRVLFIGSSFTSMNGLPGMVEVLARVSGDTALRVGSVVVPNWNLEDHYTFGNARPLARDANWEFVVIQQGTSALPASQLHLRTWAMQWEPVIRAGGAEPVLYQIWPLEQEPFNHEAALTSYHNAAVAVDGFLAPAGDAFLAAIDEDPSIGLYANDGLHPSVRGTYLAALVILSRINGVHPESLDAIIPGHTETDSVIRQLQRAAGVALARNPAKPTVDRISP